MEILSLALLFFVAIAVVCALRLLQLVRIKLVTRHWIRRIPVDAGMKWRRPETLPACRYA